MIEVAEAVSLEPIGNDRKQQMPGQMRRRRPSKCALPPSPQSPEIETAQMRDLVFDEGLGRDTIIATVPQHRISPPAWPGPEQQAKLCRP